MTITRDATSGWYIPQNAAEWTALLAGTGIANPTSLYLCQEAAGDLADSIGANTLTKFNAPSYQNAVTGWSTKAVHFGSANDSFFNFNASLGDIQTNSHLLLALAQVHSAPTGTMRLMSVGSGSKRNAFVTTTPAYQMVQQPGGTFATGAANPGTTVRPVLLQTDITNGADVVQTDQETISPTYVAPTGVTPYLDLGPDAQGTGIDAYVLYFVVWRGAAAELNATQRAKLIDLIINGPVTLTTVSVAPSSSSLAPAGTLQLTATAHYSDSSTADVTATAVWTSDNGAAATVSATGLVTGVATGVANITATFSAQAGSSAITVAGAFVSPLKPTFSVLAHAAPATGANKMLAQVSVGVIDAISTAPPGVIQTSSGVGVRPMPGPLPGDVIFTDIVTNSGGTLAMLQAGGGPTKYVVAIEGYPCLLTDADPAKAVLAHAGTDYTRALDGLFVELDLEQAIHPHDPFANSGGSCTLHVAPDSSDQFGIDTHKRLYGPEAKVVNTLNREGVHFKHPTKGGIDDHVFPWISVDHGQDFVPGDAWIGTECLVLNGPGENILSYSVRGKYSPFASGGSGGSRFAQHHRVAADSNGVWLQPVLTQVPRTWIGRLVSVWLHKVDGNGTLNARSDAQLVFAGRIAGIADNAETGHTDIDLEHILSSLRTTTIGRDMWSGTVSDSIQLQTGRTFHMADGYTSVSSRTANPLTVVDSGASGPNQINAGQYTIQEVVAAMNAWLGAENVLGNLYGTYKWTTDVATGDGLRTTCQWGMAAAAAAQVLGMFNLSLPSEIAAALGLQQSSDVTAVAGTTSIVDSHITPSSVTYTGGLSPLNQAIIKQLGPGGFYFEITVDHERGTLFDQYALLPASQKPTTSAGLQWGVFLFNEKWLLVGAKDPTKSTTTLTRVVPLTASMPGARAADVLTLNLGQPSSDTNNGPMPIRQIYVLDGPTGDVINAIMYSTGTPGYNHPTYDTLGFGFGVGCPGELLGAPWERTLARMTGSQLPIVCVIDKPTKLADLIGSDLLLRRAFLVWRNGHLEIGQWSTPTGELATIALDETNKAEPASANQPNHRSATLEDTDWVKNQVKIEWNRDITKTTGSSGDEDYNNDVTLEDQRSVDDMGGATNALTIAARNTFSQFTGTGAGVEQVAPGYLAMMPMFSQAVRKITRSIDVTMFEGNAPGDQVIVTDSFARDPETGERGIGARPGILTRIRYNPGGLVDANGKPMDVAGEVDVMVVDTHRYGAFAPAAEIDGTYNELGFSGGYKAATREIYLARRAYSEPSEATDYSHFHKGDRIRITQIDPPSADAPLSWAASIVDANGATFTIDQPLTGFTPLLSYRVTFDRFSQCVGLQLGHVFQAATATGRIERSGYAYEWASTPELADPGDNQPTDYAELIASNAYGDGVPLDAGNEQALLRTLNALLDYKSALCSPMIFNHGVVASATSGYKIVSITRVFLGLEQLNNTVVRQLTVAPWLYNATANAASLRVTLSRSCPSVQPGLSLYAGIAAFTIQFTDTFDQQTWLVPANSAPFVGQSRILTVNVKDVEGYAWLVIESADGANTLGLAQCQEGPRQT